MAAPPPPRPGASDAARKQPMHIGMADGALFGLAGLFERWRSEDGNVLDTCAIVTTEANALLAPIHDRMPLIIAPEDYARWLDPANADVADLIAPYPAAAMAYYPVSRRVNNVRNDDASVLERVGAGRRRRPVPEPEPNARRSRNRCSDRTRTVREREPCRRSGPSTAPVGRKAVGRNEQRHVIVRRGVGHAEIERDLVDEQRVAAR